MYAEVVLVSLSCYCYKPGLLPQRHKTPGSPPTLYGMKTVEYSEAFGEEHEPDPTPRPIHSDHAIVAQISSMLENDLLAACAVLLRCLKGHTYEHIGARFKEPVCHHCKRAAKGITRQAVEQRVELLAKDYPGLAGVMLDVCARENIGENDGRKNRGNRN